MLSRTDEEFNDIILGIAEIPDSGSYIQVEHDGERTSVCPAILRDLMYK